MLICWQSFKPTLFPLAKGGISGEIPRNIIVDIAENIVGIIVGDAVSVMVLATEPLLLAEAVEGYFSLKVAENIGENLSK